MTVYEMAEKYYPRLWSAERLDELVKANRLTEEERDKIVARVEEADRE